jgi:hypothetical protein
VYKTAERRAQLSELRVMKRSSSDFEGTHWGNRRKRETYRRVCTRCCTSKCRKYFCTTFGIVMRNAAEKFCAAMVCCFSEFSRSCTRQSANPWESPGGKNSIASSSPDAICRKSGRSEQTMGTPYAQARCATPLHPVEDEYGITATLEL